MACARIIVLQARERQIKGKDKSILNNNNISMEKNLKPYQTINFLNA